MYLDEGYEDQAWHTVMQNLWYEVMATRNTMRTSKAHPTYVSQAEVRQRGHELRGAISLAVRLGGSWGRSIPQKELVEAQNVARQAVNFKRIAA